MTAILMRLTALCMLSALSEQALADGRMRDSVRLIEGLITAELMLEALMNLPGALFG